MTPTTRIPKFLEQTALCAAALLFTSCIGHRIVHPVMPTAEELAVFHAAGPDVMDTGPEGLAAMHVGGGEYRIVSGDLLEIEVPPEILGGSSEDESPPTLKARVSGDGTARLPLIGDIDLAGRTTTEAEAAVAGGYFPAHLQEEPNVVVIVSEYRTASVAVMGAVVSPGIHDLRTDRMSLLGAVMAAGGIREGGASGIRIVSPGEQGGEVVQMPVRGSNIPFQDVGLRGGETIVVEPLEEKEFTVVGLVKKPGAYAYPHYRTYNLMQVLGVAGGVDPYAAPRYATVYRVDSEGQVLGCTFRLDGTALTDASNILIKPGDVVAVEHTQGSWTRQLMSQILGFRASFSANSSSAL